MFMQRRSRSQPAHVCNGYRSAFALVFVSLLLIWIQGKIRNPTVTETPRGEDRPSRISGFREDLSAAGVEITVVLLSDTHGKHRDVAVPDGDLLIYAGDFTFFGNRHDAVDFNDWLGGLPHPHKVVVAGNHDGPGTYAGMGKDGNGSGSGSGSTSPPVSLSDLPSLITNARYLKDSGYSLSLPAGRGDDRSATAVKIWGSPWQAQYPGFETHKKAGADIAGKWAEIPDDTTILVTHTPPAGVMDGGGQGCADLAHRIESLRVVTSDDDGGRRQRPPLRLVAFGHFHEHGILEDGPLTYVNCAVTDDKYILRKSPRVVKLLL